MVKNKKNITFTFQNKTTMNIKPLFFMLYIALLSACTQNAQLIIDNPTNKNIVVTLNEKQYDVKAQSNTIIEIKKGKTTMQVSNNNENNSLTQTININDDGLLNPTQSTYVVFTDLYCLENEYEQYAKHLNTKKVVVVNNKEYEEVDFQVFEDVFIPKNWDYDLNTPFPKELEIKNNYLVKSKLFSVAQLEKEFGYIGNIDFSDYESEEDVQHYLDSLEKILQ